MTHFSLQSTIRVTAKSLLLTVIGACFLVLGSQFSAGALSGDQFDPGNIIDDAVFFNSTAMTPQEIQNFLDSKVPVCDTNGTQLIGGQTRAQYGADRGNPAPYTCLKDYSETIPDIVNGGSDLCTNSISGGLKSAALLIYDVAQACSINPQVLLVLLQKEQSLITDDWPWQTQYDKATGYGCPDTAPCNAEYFGFFNQIYQAAKAFRRYEANPNSYNYRADRNNFIHYHPNLSGCGGSTVFIENQATANLYIYTPYQPNQAALDNLYGTGDSCSAYGNRNFWRMFNDWFGGTEAPNYSSTPVSLWSNSPTGRMVQGNRAYVVFKIRNTGNQTWDSSNTFLGTAGPFGRTSAFADNSWPKKNRPARLKETTVEPGQIGTFEFWYSAPYSSGTFTERFTVVIEGKAWTPYNNLFLSTKVESPSFNTTIVSAASYTDETLKRSAPTHQMAPGESAYVVLRVRNDGNVTWNRTGSNTTRLGTALPNARGSAFNRGWLSSSRVANMDQSSVAPGKIATFRFWYRAPAIVGTHVEHFSLVHEGVRWGSYFGLHLNTTIESINLSSQPVSAVSSANTATMKKGARARVTFRLRNTGNITWNKANTRIGTAEPNGRASAFRDSTWLSANRAAVLNEEKVAPGQIGSFTFWYQAPNTTGTYTEKFTPVIEGIAWLPYSGLFLSTTVTN